jgi:hypothetical protein
MPHTGQNPVFAGLQTKSKGISYRRRNTQKRPMNRKWGMAGIVVVVVIAIFLWYLFFSGNGSVKESYDFESYSYSVTIVPGSDGTYELMIPYPRPVSEDAWNVSGNVTVSRTTGDHGPCLRISGHGNSKISESYSKKGPVGSFSWMGNMCLTMTDLTTSFPDYRTNNYTAWFWSSEDNISIGLTFSCDHGRKHADKKWVSAAGFTDSMTGDLEKGWQQLKIERGSWLT